MNKLLVTLVIISLLVFNVSYIEAKKSKDKKHDGDVEPQEPHYKNGEHNHKSHHQGKWKREDDDDEDEKESEDNEEIDEEIKECPVFKKAHGCPFAHTHDAGVEYDPAKIKDCPAFGEGCPYAHGNPELMEKVKGCPAFKEGHCPFIHKDVDMDKIKECPAFKSGCPYDTAHSPHHSFHHAHHRGHYHGHPHHHAYFHALSEKKGCPYSGMEIDKISSCPAFKNGCPFDSNGRIDMEKIKECPIFKEGCPFDFSQETELTSLCPFFQTNARKNKAQQFVNFYFGDGYEEASFDPLLAEGFTYLAVTAVIPENRGTALTAEELKAAMAVIRKNFEATITFEDVVAEGNTVVVHANVEATSASTIEGLTGFAPNKTGTTRGVWIIHFDSEEKIGSVTALVDMETFRSHYQQ